jgi:hypothetical protein
VALDAQGPLLQWDLDSNVLAAASQKVSCLLRIYRRSLDDPKGNSEFSVLSEQPCQPGPGEARDNSFQWEKQYDYKAVVVTVVAAPDRPAVEVEGDDSAAAHLAAHDVFPPAVPTGLQAVFSSVGQKPFIDLAWAPDTESDLAGYVVYRRTDSSSFVVVSPSPVKATAWRDNDVRPGQKYIYSVAAVDVRGNQSAQSEPAAESVPRKLAP